MPQVWARLGPRLHADGRGEVTFVRQIKCKQTVKVEVIALQTLASAAEQMKNFAVVYLIDITEVPDFNTMYELYDPCTIMFFFRNKVCFSMLC